jgi:ABC-type arginine transport system ATPase subunit
MSAAREGAAAPDAPAPAGDPEASAQDDTIIAEDQSTGVQEHLLTHAQQPRALLA